MEDQGKRLLLALAIAFGIMLLWTFLFPPDRPEEPEEEPQRVEEERPPGEEDDAPAPEEPAPEAPEEVEDAPAAEIEEAEREPADDVEPLPEEETYAFEFDAFRAEFSSHGGALTSWELKDERWAENGELLDLVKTGERIERRPFLVSFENSTYSIPLRAAWEGERLSDREVRFVWASDDLEVAKTYRIDPENYLLYLDVDVEVTAAQAADQGLVVHLFGFQDPADDGGGGIARVKRIWQSACSIGGDIERAEFEELQEDGDLLHRGPIEWAGLQHSYFLAAASPEADDSAMLCEASAVPHSGGQMEVKIAHARAHIEAGETHRERLAAYMGPKYLSELNALSDVVSYETGFEGAVDLGFMELLARPLLWLLIWFQGFVVNWGLAIVLLTLTVKAATHYWTHKSMKSMRAMGKLRPEIEELQKKYKDDPQRLRVEMMNLYKARGVNPLSGCLPILLQMPIWFALYRALTTAGELYQAPFIPGWIDDLTVPDPYYIMPLLLMGMMFLQARLTPTTGDSTQQKILMYGMPIMFGGFSLLFPAGLTLYIFTNTALTALHHLWLRRNDPPSPTGGGAAGDKPGDKKEEGAQGAKKAVEGGAAAAAGAEGAASGGHDEEDGDEDGDASAAPADAGEVRSQGGGGRARKKGGKKKGGKKKRGGR